MGEVVGILKGFAEKPLPRVLVTTYGQNHTSPIRGFFKVDESNWSEAAPKKVLIEPFPHDLAATMVGKKSYNLAVLDIGNRIYLQNGFGKAVSSYVGVFSDIAKKKGTPVFALADRDSLQLPELWKELGEKTMFFTEKPLEPQAYQKTLETCLSIAAGAKPTLRVTNPSPHFEECLLKNARAALKKISFSFVENKTSLIPDEETPYAVTFSSDCLFVSRENERFEIVPMLHEHLGKLHTKLLEWMYTPSPRKDKKLPRYELLA